MSTPLHLPYPALVPGLEFLPAYWAEIWVKPKWCREFTKPPDLLVIHSGVAGNWVAEHLNNPIDENGHACPDGKRRRMAAAHVSYYSGRVSELLPGTVAPPVACTFVQQASLYLAIPGAGGSRCQGRTGPWAVNGRALHLELPAKPKSVAFVKGQFTMIRAVLKACVPSLKYWTTHREIDPKNKTDPVPSTGFTPDWMNDSGLEWAPRG